MQLREKSRYNYVNFIHSYITIQSVYYIINLCFCPDFGSQILYFVAYYFQTWNNILGIDIKCDQVLQLWQNDVVTRIIKLRTEGVVCY